MQTPELRVPTNTTIPAPKETALIKSNIRHLAKGTLLATHLCYLASFFDYLAYPPHHAAASQRDSAAEIATYICVL